MSYRKLKADYLFDGFNLHTSDRVLVCKPDGTIEAIVEENQAGGDLEKYSGLLSPGFVNCHCHLELSHLKGLIPENQGLVNFVFSVISQRNQPEDAKQAAMQIAETEMLAAGIVAVGDICNTGDSLAIKSYGRLAYYNFIELLGWSPAQAVSRYEFGKRVAALFLAGGQDKKHLSLNPHAPYSVSAELWDLMIPGFQGKTITIHNQESAAENEFFENGGGDLAVMYTRMKIDNARFHAPGSRSLPFYLNKLKTASRIILVHNTFMEEPDRVEALSFHEQMFFCLCPQANRYIENRLPDIPALMKQNDRLVLGTDSLASNRKLSILEEMKLIKQSFPEIPTHRMLVWATSNGARVLSFNEKLGDFSAGKKPGIVLVDHVSDGEIGGDSTCRRIL
jgi:cytosine/adenosine deaminase-related metal-dependent hydrolase